MKKRYLSPIAETLIPTADVLTSSFEHAQEGLGDSYSINDLIGGPEL